MRTAVTAVVLLCAPHARADVAEPTQEPIEPTASEAPPPGINAPGVTPIARPTAPPRYSVMVEPFSFIFATLGVQVETPINDHLALAVHGGIGDTSTVTIGERTHTLYHGNSFDDIAEVSWIRMQFGAQLNVYLSRAFRGPHVGVEGLYKHFSPDDNEMGEIQVGTVSTYGGWKWMTKSGFTVIAQAGVSMVAKRDNNETADVMGVWVRDGEGSLGAVHLWGNFAVGYSF